MLAGNMVAMSQCFSHWYNGMSKGMYSVKMWGKMREVIPVKK